MCHREYDRINSKGFEQDELAAMRDQGLSPLYLYVMRSLSQFKKFTVTKSCQKQIA